MLTSTQRYAACGLFALALNQSQAHQIRLSNVLPSLDDEPTGDGMSAGGGGSSVSDRPELWIHENSGLLLPVFRFMKVEEQTWDGLKETAGSSSQVRHHVGAFVKLLLEANAAVSTERADRELALTKAVDAMVLAMETSDSSSDVSAANVMELKEGKDSDLPLKEHDSHACGKHIEQPLEDASSLKYEMKVAVLYQLLSACLLGTTQDDKNGMPSGKGYDSRHRVTLRLLATWLDVKWIKMEAMEVIAACSLMDLAKGEGTRSVHTETSEKSWEKWEQGGIVGAAALAGGTVMAISGGLVAPAVAQGLAALAPTLGGLLPAIGAGGFAAAAGAMGSVGGSIAVAASFGVAGAGLSGSKMARRIGDIEEFEFKAIGSNHNQGRLAVGILVSGLVFKEEDFIRPWEGHYANLERYSVQWESKNLIALSTAVEDWLKSKIAYQFMQMGAMMTVLGSLVTALTLPAALLSASDIIDSKWAVALDRSDKAGKLLAEVILEGLHGNRPVTLIGFSLGARVVFKCLQYLAEAEGDHAGLVERVVLLGAPVSIKDENWMSARKMVAGRFVNAYSTNDWTLGVVFRANLVSQGLAGIQPINAPGIENVDVTEIVENHAAYVETTMPILEKLELSTYYPVWKNLPSEKSSK